MSSYHYTTIIVFAGVLLSILVYVLYKYMFYTKKELKTIESKTEITKHAIDRINAMKEYCKDQKVNEVNVEVYDYEKEKPIIKISFKCDR